MFCRRSMIWVSQACALFAMLGGCATTDEAGGAKIAGTKTTTAIPANYRQLVARHIAASRDLKTVLKAEISRPGEGWVGIFDGGNRPIACASVTFQGPLIQQGYTVAFLFENGQIAKVFYPGGYNPAIGAVGAALQEGLSCGQLSYVPFPEIVKSKR